MTSTLVGIFTRTEKAELAADELSAAGVDKAQISLSPAVSNEANMTPTYGHVFPDGPFFTGDDDDAEEHDGDREARYSQALRQGWTVLKVEVDDTQADTAADVLRQAGVLELDQIAPPHTRKPR